MEVNRGELDVGDIPKKADDIISAFAPFETIPSDEDNLIENEKVRIVTEKIKQILNVKRGGISQGHVEQLRMLSKELFSMKYSQKEGKMFVDVMKTAKEALSHIDLQPRLEVRTGREVVRETASVSEEESEELSSSYDSITSEESSVLIPTGISSIGDREDLRIEESPVELISEAGDSVFEKRKVSRSQEVLRKASKSEGVQRKASKSEELLETSQSADSVEFDKLTVEQILEKLKCICKYPICKRPVEKVVEDKKKELDEKQKPVEEEEPKSETTVYPDFSGHERKVEIMDKWTEEDKTTKKRSDITVEKAKKKVQERTQQYKKGKHKEKTHKPKKPVYPERYQDIENIRMMEDNVQVTQNELEQVDVRIRRREMLLVRDEHDVYGFQNETSRHKLKQYLRIKKFVKWFIHDIIKNAVLKVEEILVQQGENDGKIVIGEETLLKVTELDTAREYTVEEQLEKIEQTKVSVSSFEIDNFQSETNSNGVDYTQSNIFSLNLIQDVPALSFVSKRADVSYKQENFKYNEYEKTSRQIGIEKAVQVQEIVDGEPVDMLQTTDWIQISDSRGYAPPSSTSSTSKKLVKFDIQRIPIQITDTRQSFTQKIQRITEISKDSTSMSIIKAERGARTTSAYKVRTLVGTDFSKGEADEFFLAIGDFSLKNGHEVISTIVSKWPLGAEWYFNISFLREEMDATSNFYTYEVKWSQPTKESPIPAVTVSVFFRIEVSRILPLRSPVDITFVFEGNNFTYDLDTLLSPEKFLVDILASKLKLFRRITF